MEFFHLYKLNRRRSQVSTCSNNSILLNNSKQMMSLRALKERMNVIIACVSCTHAIYLHSSFIVLLTGFLVASQMPSLRNALKAERLIHLQFDYRKRFVNAMLVGHNKNVLP